jgi:O-antigen biosynthesis protein
LSGLPPRLRPGGSAIGVLGGINLAKGARVLETLAHRLPKGPRIVVLGEMDGQFRLPRPNLVHGRYERAQIGALARAYDIGAWVIPSICPETFSFSTYEALATGLPVFCFDLGAQAEAVRPASNGVVVDGAPGDADALLAALSTCLPGLKG